MTAFPETARKPGIPPAVRFAAAALAGFVVLLGIGLLAAPRARPAGDLGLIRTQAADLHSRLVAARLENADGGWSALDRTYRQYGFLLKDDKLAAVASARDAAADPAERDRLARVYDDLTALRIQAAAAAGADRVLDYMGRGRVILPGTPIEITQRNCAGLLSGEPDRALRKSWYLAARELVDNSNVMLGNWRRELDQACRTQTGLSWRTFTARGLGQDVPAMTALAGRVLEATRGEYATLMETMVPSEITGVSAPDLRAWDIPRLLRAPGFDRTFPRGRAQRTAEKWLRDFSFDLDRDGVRLQAQDARDVGAEVLVFPIANRADTRIRMSAAGGLEDFWGLFRALGEAEFHAGIDPSAPFEDQRLGSPLLPLTYGLLFQGVLLDPAWRARYLDAGSASPDRLDAALRFRRLYDLRLAAARQIYQSRSEAGPDGYAAIMEEALLWKQEATELRDAPPADDDHASGVYVTASALAAQLRNLLAERFGPEWWARPEAGAWLRQQWTRGFAIRGADLATSWGLPGLDPAPLLGAASPHAAGAAVSTGGR